MAKKAMDLIKAGTADFHFLEVMACPGGCLGGGGQPIPTNLEIRKTGRGLMRKTWENRSENRMKNPEVIKIYNDFLGKPPRGDYHTNFCILLTKLGKNLAWKLFWSIFAVQNYIMGVTGTKEWKKGHYSITKEIDKYLINGKDCIDNESIFFCSDPSIKS